MTADHPQQTVQASRVMPKLIETAIAALQDLGVREPQRESRAYYPELAHGA